MRSRLFLGGLLLIILLAAGIRWRLLEVPLERDEGEYAYAGQLILQGIPPYKQIYNMKLPGIYIAYAGIMAVFGQTSEGIHLGLLFINSATIVLVFLLGRRLSGFLTGLSAAAFFAILSVGMLHGMFAHAEHFVILPALGGILLLLIWTDKKQAWAVFVSGLLLGTDFLMKQHGAAFITFAL